MAKLSIDDLQLAGQRVLVRVDFNVPLKDGKVTDDTRIQRALPTIKKIIADGGRAILMSHLGRPKGKVVSEMSLKPVADHLSALLNAPVAFANDCLGSEAKSVVEKLADSQVALLENLRFHKAETDNDEEFSRELATLGDLYINDAFGTAHRAHASTEGVTAFFEKRAAGYLMLKEIEFLSRLLEGFERPYVAVLGGAKISGKIEVIENLMDRVDSILIGGGMAFTFLKAQGYSIGQSLLEEDKVELAGEILEKAKSKGDKIHLPTDFVCAPEISSSAKAETFPADQLPDDQKGLDVGRETLTAFSRIIKRAETIFWNGPMGVFETSPFDKGTLVIANEIAEATTAGATSIVGGGDSVAAVNTAGVADQLSHVSTGGGASLEFAEGKTLPGIAALTEK